MTTTGIPEDYSDKIRVLTSPERVEVIDYLQETGETNLEELSVHLQDQYQKEHASAELVHIHLPMLEEFGIVETYGEDIIYDGDEVVEEVIETLHKLE